LFWGIYKVNGKIRADKANLTKEYKNEFSSDDFKLLNYYLLEKQKGYEYIKTQSDYSPFLCFCSATFCQPWSLLRKAPIRAGKNVSYRQTLYEIPAKIFLIMY
jgi:hypothetical protein